MNILRAVSKRFRKKQEFHYAHISSYGICDEILRMDYPIECANTIPVNGLDTSLIGKRWIGNRWVG
jgi:hypothetical protein